MPRTTFMKKLGFSALLSILAAGTAVSQEAATPAPAAETSAAEVMPTAMLNDGWAEATLAKVERQGDKMTVRVRFQKAEGADGAKIIYNSVSTAIWESEIYVTAGDKKYLLVRDSNDKAIASESLKLSDSGPQAGAWHGTFAAPPAGESATLQLPQMEPLGPFTVPE